MGVLPHPFAILIPMKEDWLKRYNQHLQKVSDTNAEEDSFDLFMELSEINDPVDTNKGWAKVSSHIASTPSAGISFFYKVAAILVLSVSLGYLVFQSGLFTYDSTIELVATSQQAQHLLPDGSTLFLNENSSVSYNDEDFVTDRSISLKGEAFFQVKKGDTPFTVLSDLGEIQVLGTSFNVDSRVGLEVFVLEGQVRLDTKADSKILEPNTIGLVNKSSKLIEKRKVNHANSIAWKTGILAYDNVPLSQVIPELEEYYQVKIKADQALTKCKITAEFKQKSVENVIAVISSILNARSDINGKDVRLSGKGCN